jgi:hypothetical protein
VRPGDDQLRRDDRADARLVEQDGCQCAHVGEDLAFELVGLGRRRFDPSCQRAQDDSHGELVRCG